MLNQSIFCKRARALVKIKSETDKIEAERDVHFARKNSPEMLRASHRTTTIFWPLSSCLATILARRPRRCPLPSITTYFRNTILVSEICDGGRLSIETIQLGRVDSKRVRRTTGSNVDILLLSPNYTVSTQQDKELCSRISLGWWSVVVEMLSFGDQDRRNAHHMKSLRIRSIDWLSESNCVRLGRGPQP